jgi:hypothetical protein
MPYLAYKVSAIKFIWNVGGILLSLETVLRNQTALSLRPTQRCSLQATLTFQWLSRGRDVPYCSLLLLDWHLSHWNVNVAWREHLCVGRNDNAVWFLNTVSNDNRIPFNKTIEFLCIIYTKKKILWKGKYHSKWQMKYKPTLHKKLYFYFS